LSATHCHQHPTSKAGSVAHSSVEVFAGNVCQHIAGQPMTGRVDEHANCCVESGDGKGPLIDFTTTPSR
jgi:sulfide:quinone oxidoreductase